MAMGRPRPWQEASDETRRTDLQRDFVASHDRFRTELGIAVPRAYLLTIGTRG